jgi:prepilin-type N-terminal cleavage/methylation domain-containing protein
MKDTAQAERRGRGFTLLELIVVVSLLGILVAVSTMISSSTDSLAAAAAGRMVMQDLEYAQSEAIRRQESITVTFDVGGNGYTVTESSGDLLVHPTSGGSYTVNLPSAVRQAGVDLTAADFGGGGAVTFNASGEPVLPGVGQVPVASTSAVVIQCGEAACTVNLSPITGKLTSQMGG